MTNDKPWLHFSPFTNPFPHRSHGLFPCCRGHALIEEAVVEAEENIHKRFDMQHTFLELAGRIDLFALGKLQRAEAEIGVYRGAPEGLALRQGELRAFDALAAEK